MGAGYHSQFVQLHEQKLAQDLARAGEATMKKRFPVILHHILEMAEHLGYQDIISWWWSPAIEKYANNTSSHLCSTTIPSSLFYGGHSTTLHQVDGVRLVAFRVHDPIRFERLVMPHFFNTSRYKSFQRNLNLHAFKSVPFAKYAYQHPLFQPGSSHLSTFISRPKKMTSCQTETQESGLQHTVSQELQALLLVNEALEQQLDIHQLNPTIPKLNPTIGKGINHASDQGGDRYVRQYSYCDNEILLDRHDLPSMNFARRGSGPSVGTFQGSTQEKTNTNSRHEELLLCEVSFRGRGEENKRYPGFSRPAVYYRPSTPSSWMEMHSIDLLMEARQIVEGWQQDEEQH